LESRAESWKPTLSVESKAATMTFALEDTINVCVCQTCAERGRPNEPVYKLGMCEFCYHGLPHPKATREQLARERMGAYARQRRSLLHEEDTAPDTDARQQENQKSQRKRIIDRLVSRNGSVGG
jgi:hypothetical protein